MRRFSDIFSCGGVPSGNFLEFLHGAVPGVLQSWAAYIRLLKRLRGYTLTRNFD